MGHDALDSLPPSLAAMFSAKAEAAKENILHQQRLQQARELADVQIEAEKEKAAIRAAGRPRRQRRLTHKKPNDRETTILTAIQRSLKGSAYAAYMDEGRMTPPLGTKSHVQAYKQYKLRRKMEREKSRVKSKFSHLLSRES